MHSGRSCVGMHAEGRRWRDTSGNRISMATDRTLYLFGCLKYRTESTRRSDRQKEDRCVSGSMPQLQLFPSRRLAPSRRRKRFPSRPASRCLRMYSRHSSSSAAAITASIRMAGTVPDSTGAVMPSAGGSAGVADTAGMAGIIVGRMRTVAAARVLIWAVAPVVLVRTRAVGRVADGQAHIRVHMAADGAVAAADTVIVAKPTQVSSQRHEEPGSFRALCLFRRRFSTLGTTSDRRDNTVAEMPR